MMISVGDAAIVTAIGVNVLTGEAFLTPYERIRIMTSRHLADVAELADAQVSEACDGDIVEVQVLSSAPKRDHPQITLVISV